jgi:hypothetical protein
VLGTVHPIRLSGHCAAVRGNRRSPLSVLSAAAGQQPEHAVSAQGFDSLRFFGAFPYSSDPVAPDLANGRRSFVKQGWWSISQADFSDEAARRAYVKVGRIDKTTSRRIRAILSAASFISPLASVVPVWLSAATPWTCTRKTHWTKLAIGVNMEVGLQRRIRACCRTLTPPLACATFNTVIASCNCSYRHLDAANATIVARSSQLPSGV